MTMAPAILATAAGRGCALTWLGRTAARSAGSLTRGLAARPPPADPCAPFAHAITHCPLPAGSASAGSHLTAATQRQ